MRSVVILQCCIFLLASIGLGAPYEPNAGNDTERRSFSVDPAGAGLFKPWPNGEVRFCTDKSVSPQFLSTTWQQAWDKWNEGLKDRSSLRFTELGPCSLALQVHPDALQVFLAEGVGSSRTTIRYASALTNRFMKFDPDPAAGFGNTVTNLAHEMGHAFGLVHGHQRPDAGKGVPRISFACENLRDYQSYKDRHYDMERPLQQPESGS